MRPAPVVDQEVVGVCWYSISGFRLFGNTQEATRAVDAGGFSECDCGLLLNVLLRPLAPVDAGQQDGDNQDQCGDDAQ